jgi:hypothetical protein
MKSSRVIPNPILPQVLWSKVAQQLSRACCQLLPHAALAERMLASSYAVLLLKGGCGASEL